MKTQAISLALAALLLGCRNETAPPPPAAATPVGMAWTAQGDSWAEGKAALQAFGEQFDTSWALY